MSNELSDLRKAAEMALETLETTWGDGSEGALKQWEETIQALRQTLAQPDLARVGEVGVWGETPPCKTHPDAPHGFDRNASHSADRYVCECESWEPDRVKVSGVPYPVKLPSSDGGENA